MELDRRVFLGIIAAFLISMTFVAYCLIPEVKLEEGIKPIEVVKHFVKDSYLDKSDFEDFLLVANQTFNCSFYFVQVGEYNHTSFDNTKNQPGKINIWAVPKKTWGEPDVSGQRGNEIQLTLGTESMLIKDSTLSHELAHVFKLKAHSTDPYNVLKADIVGGKRCYRKGTNLTDDQQERARMGAYSFTANEEGQGQDMYDASESNVDQFMNIRWVQAFAKSETTGWTLNLTLETFTYKTLDCWYSFLIESDNDLFTGDPIDGTDYMISFNPAYNFLEFSRYDFTWISLDTSGIIQDYSYACGDLDSPLTIVGTTFSLPLSKLERRSGTTISVRATTNNMTHQDRVPETGFLNLSNLDEPPPPPPPPPPLPEFPQVIPITLLFIPLIIYLWWRTKKTSRDVSLQKRTLTKDASIIEF